MNIKKQKTVFVGLSGGVDSAVSAALLKKAGHEVIGVFIKTWHPDFLVCNEEEERHDAMRVAAALDIPFLTFDLSDVYKKEVGDYMIREYRAGRTPNPDVMCNKEVKFGAFLKKSVSMGADFVATGHYAQAKKANAFVNGLAGVEDPENRGPEQKHLLLKLFKGKDPSKDQSYFLWTLRQEQLNKILFPIGHLKKTEVRKLAKKFNLPVAEKKDSQGICFLGAVDLKEFLKHYIKEKKGKVINEEGGVIGHHDGVVFHTLGERHGFTITKKGSNDGRYYIVAKDIKKNILVVSNNKDYLKKGLENATGVSTRNFLAKKYPYPFLDNLCIDLENTNWITEIPKDNKNYTAQIRYHGEFLSCKIKIKNKKTAEVIFSKPVMVASGQFIVVYDGDTCLGGGVVK